MHDPLVGPGRPSLQIPAQILELGVLLLDPELCGVKAFLELYLSARLRSGSRV
jgi:hypothetical protein